MSYVFKIKKLGLTGESSDFSEWYIVPAFTFIKIYFSANKQQHNIKGFGVGLKWLRWAFYISFMIKKEIKITQVTENKQTEPEYLDITSLLNNAPKISIAKSK